MTKQSTRRAEVTLPLLIAYIDALLPTLAQATDAQTNTQSDSKSTKHKIDDKPDLLWVTEDKNTLALLNTALTNHAAFQASDTTQPADKLASSTLLALNQQPVSERYELVCFWLPTLSAEQLQQYIPLLMRYRDLYAAHLLIALEHNIDLQPYGFTPFDILQTSTLTEDTDLSGADMTQMPAAAHALGSATLWQFNLYDYKQLPNWLNADYWANPENWDKHRW
ncbi:DUF6231 family protein [uncultured Psychrobacter sp.]|uniref:DUF6231 family protein n=1 Tax=uncultured Psychrobacter sp. TaxID=259303 RepID=UPI0025925F8F|nr:DUF6231 family protein [uncultured Psychrobacter sp.]